MLIYKWDDCVRLLPHTIFFLFFLLLLLVFFLIIRRFLHVVAK